MVPVRTVDRELHYLQNLKILMDSIRMILKKITRKAYLANERENQINSTIQYGIGRYVNYVSETFSVQK